MKPNLIVVSILTMLISFLLTACGEKSIEYYEQHPDEARVAIVDCMNKSEEVLPSNTKCWNPNRGLGIYHAKRQIETNNREIAALRNHVK